MTPDEESSSPADGVSVAVVIASYTETRWPLLLRVIECARAQTLRPESVVVVVDHNEPLFSRLTEEVPGGVTVTRNLGPRGAGGARNAGAGLCDTQYVAFLDDDVAPPREWLERLVSHLRHADVVGAGCGVWPEWESAEPTWFPRECGWVIGLRDGKSMEKVRNVWSAGMVVDRAAFVAAGGFLTAFGKVGTVSEPEDTELCIRLSHITGQGWVFEPSARLLHHVPAKNATVGFFLRRCWMEGRGKAALRARLAPSVSALDDERRFLVGVLPRACTRYLRDSLRGDVNGLARAALLIAGAATTCLAFLVSKPGPGRTS